MFDWGAEAVTMADYANKHMSDAHRGAMPGRQLGIIVVFGNDGYEDDRTKLEVAMLREEVLAAVPRMEILGFGVDSTDGYSWAMLVRPVSDIENDFLMVALNDIISHCARKCGFGNAGYQAGIAKNSIAKHGIRPVYSAN